MRAARPLAGSTPRQTTAGWVLSTSAMTSEARSWGEVSSIVQQAGSTRCPSIISPSSSASSRTGLASMWTFRVGREASDGPAPSEASAVSIAACRFACRLRTISRVARQT